MLFNYNGVKLEINNRKSFEKLTTMNFLQRINEPKKKNDNKINKYFEIIENENNTPEEWDADKTVLGEKLDINDCIYTIYTKSVA